MLGFSPLSAAPLASNEVQFSSPGNASGSIDPINLSAPTGSAKGKASASGSIAQIILTAPNGTASISGAIPAFASGSIRPIYLTAPRGSATPGQITYARAPSGSGYAPRVEYSFRPEQINTTRH